MSREAEASVDCPLCGRPLALTARELYGVPVCARCSGAFFWRRAAAAAIDMLLFYLLLPGACFGASYLLAASWPFTSPGIVDTLVVLVIIVICLGALVPPLLYFFKDGCAGYSPGKWLCGLRVINVRTRRAAGVAQSGLRNMLLGFFPPLGIALAGQVRRGPRWGDELAVTRVVWWRYRDSPVFCPPQQTPTMIKWKPAAPELTDIHQGA